MLGIAFHSPNTVSVMLDRKKFNTYVLFNSPTEKNIKKYNKWEKGSSKDGRIPVVLSKSFDLFKKWFNKNIKLDGFKILLFDSLHNLLKHELQIVDAVFDTEQRCSMFFISQEYLNRELSNSVNFIKEKLEKPYKNINHVKEEIQEITMSQSNEYLHKLINEVLELVESEDVTQFINSTYEYSAGLLESKTYTKIKKRIIDKGIDQKELRKRIKKVTFYLDSDSGYSLFYAFSDMCFYGTSLEDAHIVSGCNVIDLKDLVARIHPSNKLQFVFNPPKGLVTLRKYGPCKSCKYWFIECKKTLKTEEYDSCQEFELIPLSTIKSTIKN